MQEFEETLQPGYVNALSSLIFHQDSTTKNAEQEEVFMGTGKWQEREEEQDVHSDISRIANKQTFTTKEFADSIKIPRRFYADAMHGSIDKMVKEFGEMGRISRDDNAIKFYRNAFTTSLTADGVAFGSNSHKNINGDTIDNLETAALDEGDFNTMIIKLAEMKNQRGIVRGYQPNVLFVPITLFKTAAEILDSQLKSGTTDNDNNIYLTKYGIALATSPYLGAAAGGSDSAFFLLSKNHSVRRWVREAVDTRLIPWEQTTNNNYVYKGFFREMVGGIDAGGAICNNGTT